MRMTRAIGFVLVCGLTIGLGCQLIAGLDQTPVVYEPVLEGGAGGTGGMGGMVGMTSATAASSSSSGNGGMGGAGGMGGMGGAPECLTVSDCIGPECRTAIGCDDGVCMWQNTPDGTPLSSQLHGDCMDRVCDGNGGVKLVPGDPDKDTYDWANPCYINGCQAFPMPLPWPDMPVRMCTTPWGNTMGKCSFYKCIECKMDTDCTNSVCVNYRCIPPTCTNGMKDGLETDIDCGGTACHPCTADKKCSNDGDCEGLCNTMKMECVAPSCSDGQRNSDETDIDCGGGCATQMPPKGCAVDQKCLYPKDCASGVCKSGICQEPACNDYVKNQDEAGIDCGGQICSPCAEP